MDACQFLRNKYIILVFYISLTSAIFLIPIKGAFISAIGHSIDDLSSINSMQQAFPNFRWPWPDYENGNIFWSSGPHSWSTGGQFTARIDSSHGSGLDFVKSGTQAFSVLAMASGTVYRDRCGYSGLGCIVAIRHDVGGSIMIYAHLKERLNQDSNKYEPDNNISEGMHIQQGTVLGTAGQSGGQEAIHLHIEFRDGSSVCTATPDCGDIGWSGNPVPWDGRILVDDYYIAGYCVLEGETYGDCTNKIYNYDGSAVKGSIAKPFSGFPYLDNGEQRYTIASVHENFECTSKTNCEIDPPDHLTVFALHGLFGGGGSNPPILLSSNTAIFPPNPEPTPPPIGPSDGIEFCETTNFGQPCQTFVYINNDLCVNLANTGWDDRADSLRFKGNYIGNYEVILYDDISCSIYNARYGQDAADLKDFKHKISSIRIEKLSSPPPTTNDGVQFCDGTQFGDPCQIFTYTSNDTCIDLASYGWDNRADSMRFQGSYVTGHEVIMYDDNGCSIYNARYGQDTADLGDRKNQISSIRIERNGEPAGPDDGIELCDGLNYGPPCQTYYHSSNDRCIDLAVLGWDNRAESLHFLDAYIGGFEIILYDDNNCQIYNARYGSDTPTLDAYNNKESSIRIEKLGPPPPDLLPYPRSNGSEPIIISSINGTGTNNTLYAGQPIYIDWGYKNIGESSAGFHYVNLYIDDQQIIHYPFSGLGVGYLGGFDDWATVWYTPGWHTVKLVVDENNDINESDESNNMWERDFYWNQAATCSECGLSAGPWSMFRHDLRHTGRSLYNAPDQPVVKWKFQPAILNFSDPAISSDGKIYVGLGNKLFALDKLGNPNWIFTMGNAVFSPLIAADGTVYVGSTDGRLYAFLPDGSLNWSFIAENGFDNAPAVGIDGTIYIGGNDGRFYALNPDGSIKWDYYLSNMAGISSPAIGSDGSIYIRTTSGLLAFEPGGNLKWSYPLQYSSSAPAIGSDGTLYVGSSETVYAIKQNGTLKWSYNIGSDVSYSSPAIGYDDTIYIGSEDNSLYALYPNGTLKWIFTSGGEVRSSPVVTIDGTILFGSYDGNLYAIHSNGSIKWSIKLNGWLEYGPVIGEDTTIYIGDVFGSMFAVSESENTKNYLPMVIH